MSVDEPIHVVALAARTHVGLYAESSAAAVRAGISRVGEHPFMVDAAGNPLLCGIDRSIAPERMGPQRLRLLAESVIDELYEKLPEAMSSVRQVPCWLALPEPRPGFTEQVLQAVIQDLGLRRSPASANENRLIWQAITQGHAGAVLGLERAVQALRAGSCDLCIVAGADSYFDADTIDWLEQGKRLARDGIRGAFPPGEGAALLAIASDTLRRRLALPSLAIVTGTANGIDPGDEDSDEGLLGVGLTDVYARLETRLPQGARFEDVYIDINDERARTTDYAFATLRRGAAFRDASRYTTSVSCTGELGAASAPFHCVLAVRSFQRGYASGEYALVSSASWGGLRGATLLQPGLR